MSNIYNICSAFEQYIPQLELQGIENRKDWNIGQDDDAAADETQSWIVWWNFVQQLAATRVASCRLQVASCWLLVDVASC